MEPDLLRAQFKAMASDCEALIDTREAAVAQRAAVAVSDEALRIEQKFSRYRADNIVHAINNANGAAVEVDAETADLLDYAAHCHAVSDGKFDVTSGVHCGRRDCQTPNATCLQTCSRFPQIL